MKAKELIKILEKDPEMEVYLLDTTTDDVLDSGYAIKDKTVYVDDYVDIREDEDTIAGKCIWIEFENRLNPNPIN